MVSSCRASRRAGTPPQPVDYRLVTRDWVCFVFFLSRSPSVPVPAVSPCKIAGVPSVPVGDEQKVADLAGDEPIERRGRMIIARLDQRYKLVLGGVGAGADSYMASLLDRSLTLAARCIVVSLFTDASGQKKAAGRGQKTV